jgi:hypothetical protein
MESVGASAIQASSFALQVGLQLSGLVTPDDGQQRPASGDLLVRVLKVAARVLGASSSDTRQLMLVALWTLQAEDLKDWLDAGDPPESELRAVLPRLQAIEFLARGRSIEWLAVWTRVRYFAAILDQFEAAIAPRPLHAVLEDVSEAKARLSYFRLHRNSREDTLRKHTRPMLAPLGLSPAAIDELFEAIPIRRLRTYHPDLLLRVAGRWHIWSPLVRVVRGADHQDTDAQARLRTEVIARVKHSLQKRCKARSQDIEDAVQDALLSEIAGQREGKFKDGAGYTYEVDYPNWLVTIALHKLWRTGRHRARELELDPSRLLAPTRPVEDRKRNLEWKSRFLLATSFFQVKAQGHVSDLFSWAIENSSDSARLKRDERVFDSAFAEMIRKKTGKKIPLKTISTWRYRFLQRLEVLRYLRDCPPAVAATRGDETVLAYIDENGGYTAVDMPTLRHLAAFARAAGAEQTLAWPLLARRLMDTNQFTVPQASADLIELLHASAVPEAEIARRLAVALAWEPTKPARKHWTALRNPTRAVGLYFLLSPCWLLTVLQDQDFAHIAHRLVPVEDGLAEHVPEQIERIVKALSGART